MRRDKKIIRHIERLQQKEGIFLKLQPERNLCGLMATLIAGDSLGRPIKPGDKSRMTKRADELSHNLYQKGFFELDSNERILMALLKENGFRPVELTAGSAKKAVVKLYRALNSWPVILNVVNCSHWVVARAKRIGGQRKVVCISDPERTIQNLRRTAHYDAEEKELVRLWRDKKGWWNKRRKKRISYYGIVVKK